MEPSYQNEESVPLTHDPALNRKGNQGYVSAHPLNRRAWLVLAIVSLVIVPVVLIPVLIHKKSDGGSSSTRKKNKKVCESKDVLLDLVATVAPVPAALKEPTSPQYEAFNWLKESADWTDACLNKDQIATIYALVTIHFSVDKKYRHSDGLDVLGGELVRWNFFDDDASFCSACGGYEGYSAHLVLRGGLLTEIHLTYPALLRIPREIGLLKDLKVFKTDDVMMEGVLPTEIGLMTKLEEFDLGSGHELGIYGNCEDEDTPCHALEGHIPTEFGLLKNLKVLNLGDNALTGSVPAELTNLDKLEKLSLYRNCLEGLLPDGLWTLSSLKSVDLRQNALDGYQSSGFASSDTPIPQDWRTTIDPSIHSNECDCFRESHVPYECRDYGASFKDECLPLPPLCTRAPKGMCMKLLDRNSDCSLIKRPVELGGYPDFVVSSECSENTEDRVQAFRDNLLSHDATIADRLATEDSPQARAFAWMIEKDALGCLTPLSQVQRFVLSSFYYATTTFNKEDETFSPAPWMDPTKSECDWTGDLENYNWFYRDRRALVCMYSGELAQMVMRTKYSSDGHPIPQELVLLSKLQKLHIEGGFRGSSLPTFFSKMTSLTEFHLDCGFGGQVPSEYGLLTNLVALTIDTWGSGPMPQEIGSLTKLRYLNMDAGMNGTIPASIGSLSNLEHLGLRSNALEGPIPKELFTLTGLRHVNLRNNYFKSALPVEFADFPKLEVLKLGSNQWTGVLPTVYGTMSNLRDFELSCYHCKFSTSLPAEWGSMSSLEKLEMGQFPISGALPTDWGALSNLKVVELRYSNITSKLPVEWSAMSSLEELHLGDNNLHGSIPEEYASLTSLRELWLSSNPNMTGYIPTIRSAGCAIYFDETGISSLGWWSDDTKYCKSYYNYTKDREPDCVVSYPKNCMKTWCPEKAS